LIDFVPKCVLASYDRDGLVLHATKFTKDISFFLTAKCNFKTQAGQPLEVPTTYLERLQKAAKNGPTVPSCGQTNVHLVQISLSEPVNCKYLFC